ncbi:MAG: Mth938-like domain-containing protein [Candidatus Micrarchaeota archaeon]
MIESYSFGRMVVDGREYRSDLKLLPSGIKPEWWRLEGHLLQLADIEDVLAENPKTIVVGTGHDGRMEVARGVRERCREEGITLIELQTGEAVNCYNELAGKGVVGLFHLTC